jgi:hypothetical protein
MVGLMPPFKELDRQVIKALAPEAYPLKAIDATGPQSIAQ